ncbi:T9SS type A sorting domain-containing protein [Flavobacterium silvaticum]|uniref:T9SS type A sorting domain-containing protein n=1 Tax=Flavobacterium silvaticum TaxID=1852020 RepID=A0A972JGR6_9FLAO|nr:T9SS type A sorting domain-containing protein [Flavobacterium silvaticum]NMH27165.1 T9SS type A sorting domain-containing protein [Flavobacterium silvaticum]
MKQIYAPTFVLVMLWFSAAVCQRGDRVLICHVPPGNPSGAYTTSLTPFQLTLHTGVLHHDFPGDCWQGCTASEVVSFTQGLQSNGTPVAVSRSNPDKALGSPDSVNEVGGFYSLGFGGSIILKMDGGILNRPGNDLLISETSYHQPSCESYPEKAEVFVSEDNVSWTSLGVICQDAEVDIAPLDWILYVKIVDVSDASSFSGVVDGFDVDGIQCLNAPQQRQMAIEENPQFSLFPNPAKEMLNIRYSGFMDDDVIQIEVLDLNGRSELKTEAKVHDKEGVVQVSASAIKPGSHILSIIASSGKQVIRFEKR